jgi:hypothetical protein
VTTTGVGRRVVLPSPSSPDPLSPQHEAAPADVSAHACAHPALTDANAIGDALGAGVRLFVAAPVPSCPAALLPQQYATPAALTPQLNRSPALGVPIAAGGGGAVTVIVAVPLVVDVCAVMVAVPGDTPDTSPDGDTVTIEAGLLVHVT